MDIFIDFEVFSHLDIRKTSAWRYWTHESTEVLCMAWAINDLPVKLWVPGDPTPNWFADIETATLHAHNAAFERIGWGSNCVPRLGWPEVRLEQWECTAARAAAVALPRSLAGAAKALNLKQQKDDAGRLAMLQVVKLDKKGKRNTNAKAIELMREYCKNDVEVERAIHKATPPLWEPEKEVYHLDQRINDRGIPIDIESVNAAIEILEQFSIQQE